MTWSAEDIEKYLSGKLTPVQMHAMEKAALDDPFLAEAMEGYESMKGKDWNTGLVALRQQFAEVKPLAKLIPINKSSGRWWKAVAAILVIGCGTTLTYLVTKDKSTDPETQQIAQNITKEKTTDTRDPGTSTAPEKTAVQPVQISPAENKPANKMVTTQNSRPVMADSAFVFKPAKQDPVTLSKNEGKIAPDRDKDIAPVSNGKTDITVTSNSNMTSAETTVNNTKANNAPPVAIADEEKKRAKQHPNTGYKSQPLNRSFSAQVFGQDNLPLPFSNISIKSENFGTYTDVKGNFSLVSSDSILTVDVRSVGYLPRTYTLRSNQAQQRIVLAEDEIVLKEKTVIKDRQTTNNRLSRRATLIKDSVVNVEPADGWDNYSTYIANNIEFPDDILQQGKHGEIGISFEVKSNGTISNIKIDHSDCNDCGELTRRLIEQGPQWKLTKGKKASAKVKVRF